MSTQTMFPVAVVERKESRVGNIDIFKNEEFGDVRAIKKDGMFWFIARDVCQCLSIENVGNVIASLDDDEITTIQSLDCCNDFSSLRKDTRLVSESGLYSIVLRSTKKEAKRFKRWITHEVLPALRKTGKYEMPNQQKQEEHMPLTALNNELDILERILSKGGVSDQQVAFSMNRYVRNTYGKDLLAISETPLVNTRHEQRLTPTELGKELGGISGRKVNLRLADAGLQVRLASGEWQPTDEGKKYSEFLETGKYNGQGVPVLQLKWYTSVLEKLSK